MARASHITYEMVRQTANRFLAAAGRMPANLEIQHEIGGSSDLISRHMRTWREETRALRGKPASISQPLEAAFSFAVDIAIAEQTATLTEQLTEAQEDADTLRREMSAMREDLDESKEALDRERQRNAALEAQLNDARIDLSRHQGALSRANDELIRLSQEVGCHQSDLSTERQKSVALEVQLANLSAAQATLAQQVHELTINLAVAQNRRNQQKTKEGKQ